MRSSLIALAGIAACYSPSAPSGARCNERDECPGDQVCNLATGICDDPAQPGVDGSLDPDAEDSLCDPTEELVDGACTIPITQDAPAIAVSPAGCDTQQANNSRSVGIDAGNRIYVAVRCGAMDEVFVATSDDGGATVNAPVPLAIASADHVAVRGGPRKVAYVAVSGMTGVSIAVTTDGGLTWTSQVLTNDPVDDNFGVSVVSRGDSVWVAAELANVRVWRNATRGTGAFESTDEGLNGSVFGELLVEQTSGTMWIAGDTPALHLKRSTDGGIMFGSRIDPGAMYNFSEWAIGNGTIFVSGSQNTFTRIPTDDPTMDMQANATLPDIAAQGRALAAGLDNSLYIANQRANGNAITVLHVAPGAEAATATRDVGTGTGPAIAVGTGTVVPYAFTETATMTVKLGVFVF